MKDHLGNIRVTVSDKKFNTALTIAATSATSYLPFGMVEPNMFVSASGHRYGYNGMEKDNEIKGDANILDFSARIYDPRSGRFLSLDPDKQLYPMLSSYNYAANDPIRLIDEDGKGPKDRVKYALDYFGIPYKQDGNRSASDNSKKALATMDCSELVGRVLYNDGFSNFESSPSTSDYKATLKVANFEQIKIQDIQPGDIVLFQGHVGIAITSADEKGNYWIMDAHTDGINEHGVFYTNKTPAMPSQHNVKPAKEDHGSFKPAKVYRPKVDTPDETNEMPVLIPYTYVFPKEDRHKSGSKTRPTLITKEKQENSSKENSKETEEKK